MITLFLCGDVMLGRGIDQIMPHPSDPQLYEGYLTSAVQYVELAEREHGPLPRKCDYAYVWGDALEELDKAQPDARIINLETSITTSAEPVPKGINYKMHPLNVAVLTVAKTDCCVLANNHVLDWGLSGLIETLATLEREGIKTVGAGRNEQEAARPAIINISTDNRILVFAFGEETSGIERDCAASAASPGIELLPDLSDATARQIIERIGAVRQPGDIVLVSIHWGLNWGYQIDEAQRRFAHTLIDAGVCHVLHGHSSHHPRAIEVYRDQLILYGCGDFINDYEGITGYEQYRDDLTLMYLPKLSAQTGRLEALTLVPFQIHRFRLRRAIETDVAWLQKTLDRESKRFGTHVIDSGDGKLAAIWQPDRGRPPPL